jgi:hypothetical protein
VSQEEIYYKYFIHQRFYRMFGQRRFRFFQSFSSFRSKFRTKKRVGYLGLGIGAVLLSGSAFLPSNTKVVPLFDDDSSAALHVDNLQGEDLINSDYPRHLQLLVRNSDWMK